MGGASVEVPANIVVYVEPKPVHIIVEFNGGEVINEYQDVLVSANQYSYSKIGYNKILERLIVLNRTTLQYEFAIFFPGSGVYMSDGICTPLKQKI
jgi:hypothetical protein